jgi:dipeptidyl-peptidase-4
MVLKRILLVCIVSLFSVITHAQKKQLSDAQYFQNNYEGIIQPLPYVIRFQDNKHVLLRKGKNFVTVNIQTGKETPFAEPVSLSDKPLVQIKEKDIYLNDVRITFDSAVEVNPTLSPDNQYLAYTKNNNLYTYHIKTSKEIQRTQDGSALILNGYASWVYMEEILGRRSSYRAFWWSPNSKQLAFFRSDDTKVPEYTLTDDGGTHGYVEKLRYPKPGDVNPSVKVGIVHVDGEAITWSDFNENDDQYFGLPYWTPDGKTLLVQWMNRAQNQLKIFAVNPSNGQKSIFYEQTSKTWINLDDEGSRIYFIPNSNKFLLLSDENGFNHIYLHEGNGKRKNAVTKGNLMVSEILWYSNQQVIFTGKTEENSTVMQVFRADLSGKKITQLTNSNYSYSGVQVSRDGKSIVYTYGNAQTPNRIDVLHSNGKTTNIADSKGKEFDQYAIAQTEIFRVKSADGKFDLPVRIIMPLNAEAGKKYPVLISIYGGPARSDVMDRWVFNGTQQWYAREGLIQVVLDHRGSGHFGKRGTDYLFHNLGYWEMQDYIAQVKWLIEHRQADPERIAITGFSYGGYLSAYALTYGADYFTHAMAGGSVTDWSLYDTHYTERYMGTPQTNPEGYKSSSVFSYTQQYKGVLQLVHGLIDENVHPQNTIRLATDLQNKNKTFELMLYSGNRHGIRGKQGVHYANLKTLFIYKYLLRKTAPDLMLR